jgi:transposase
MSDMLNLLHLKVAGVHDRGDHYRIEAVGDVVPTVCPNCGHSPLYRHGTQQQSFMDTPMHGKRVLLDIERRRYRCTACGKTLFDPLPDMDGKRFMTQRLVEFVKTHCLRRTFATLARDVGVDNKTVRLIFDDYAAHLKATVHYDTPRILGIDEIKIIGDYRCVLTDIERLSMFDMLPTRKKVDLLTYFRGMPDKPKVEVITMDLWSVYRQVVRDQFPGRLVVADRFHAVRMASDAMERVRKAIRKSLPEKARLKLKDDRKLLLMRRHRLDDKGLAVVEQWSTMYPALGAAYTLKELFHSLYEQDDKPTAQRVAEAWLNSIPDELARYFRETAVALQSWWDEIFAYYDVRITNAYTESVNNIAKEMHRMGRGYSFDVIRARLLYNDEARADTRETIRKKPRKATSPPAPDLHTFTTIDLPRAAADRDVQVIEHGPSLITLARLLREGHFY